MSGRAGYMTDEIAGVLAGAEVEGTALRLSRQLDRKTYKKVNEVLETLGGIWNRRAKAHVFPRCPRAVIAAAMGNESAEEAPDELERDRIKRLQFFQTPDDLAERMALWAVRLDDEVLEPSAGHGRLVQAALWAGAKRVSAVELDTENCRVLARAFQGRRVDVRQENFIAWAETRLVDEGFEGFDAVLMNPPFRNNQDIRHVLAAAKLLRPGGRLAAVMSPHFTFAQDKESRFFKHRLGVRGATIEVLPHGTFREEGTDVSAVLVTVQREG